jgi:hypothetical protein
LRIKTELVEVKKIFDIKRTMEDFFLLRKLLVKRYPYLLVAPLPTSIRFTKVHLFSMKRRVQRFLDFVLKSEVLKSDTDFILFLVKDESITLSLNEKLREKPKELGLFNVYTEEGQIRIQTNMMSAIYASKFPEMLQSFEQGYNGMFASIKDIRDNAAIIHKKYK